MFALQSYQNKLGIDGINNPDSVENSFIFDNESVIIRKPNDHIYNYSGKQNVVSGFDAAKSIKNANNNVFIGHSSGYYTNNNVNALNTTKLSSDNVFIGNESGYHNINGYSNIFIGNYNSKYVSNDYVNATDKSSILNNIGIGTSGSSKGGNTICIGNLSETSSKNSITFGHISMNSTTGYNSLVVGNKIKNYGPNSFILRANGIKTNPTDINFLSYSNHKANYFNLNDVFEGIIGDKINVHQPIDFQKNVEFQSNCTFSNIVVRHLLEASNASFCNILGDVHFKNDDNVFIVDGYSTFNNQVNVNRLSVLNDAYMYGNLNVGDYLIVTDYAFNVNVDTFFNDNVTFQTDTTFNKSLLIQQDFVCVNNGTFSNDLVIEKNATIHEDLNILHGRLFIDGSNILDIIADNDSENTFEIQVTKIIPWLTSNQGNVNLSKFNNDLAPWLTYESSNIHLSDFSNDIAPWLDIEQSNVYLSSFCNNLAPWLQSNQHDINLSSFTNDLAQWLTYNQNNVNLSEFNNDLSPWLRFKKSDITLSGFSNDLAPWIDKIQENVSLKSFSNDLAPWIKEYQNLISLSNFDNDLAPWLKYNPYDINLSRFSNDVAPWLMPAQSNVRLRFFLNDLAPWLRYYSSNVMISIFTHDSLDVKSNSYFHSNVDFYDEVFFHSNVFFNNKDSEFVFEGKVKFNGDLELPSNATFPDGIHVDGPATFCNDVSINCNLVVQGTSEFYQETNFYELSTFHSNLIVKNDNGPVFSVIDSNVSIDGFLNINGGGFIMDEDGFTLSNDLFVEGNITCLGALICGSVTIQPYHEYYRVIQMAMSNLIDFSSFDTGMTVPGAYFTPYENVFFKPTYFLDHVFFTCNPFKIDPIVYLDFFAKCNLYVGDHLYGSEYTCNLLIGSDTYVEKNLFVTSNIYIDGGLFGNSNTDILTINSETVFEDDVTFNGVIKAGEYNDSNILIISNSIFHNNVYINSNLYIDGNLYGNQDSNLTIAANTFFDGDISLSNNLFIFPETSNTESWWRMFTKQADSIKEADLFFVSQNGTAIKFSDHFEESIINFTGQHRCTTLDDYDDINSFIGKIVSSTGEYSDLYDSSEIHINEAVPIVKLSSNDCDKRVFGVISGQEENNLTRTFNIGNLSFLLNKKLNNTKIMVNSVGEGGIWICNLNGNLYNGDYITTCEIPGLGVLQKNTMGDSDTILHNYTVAKITCDCTFDIYSDIYKCEQFIYNDEYYHKAFVGCVYYC